jgi:hypothetical protein
MDRRKKVGASMVGMADRQAQVVQPLLKVVEA